jgi:hypothetical protein
MVFGQRAPGRFNSYLQLQTLFEHARIVAVIDPKTKELVTDIAFENTQHHELVKLVDDIFQTRAVMHEQVYQCGCVPHVS